MLGITAFGFVGCTTLVFGLTGLVDSFFGGAVLLALTGFGFDRVAAGFVPVTTGVGFFGGIGLDAIGFAGGNGLVLTGVVTGWLFTGFRGDSLMALLVSKLSSL